MAEVFGDVAETHEVLEHHPEVKEKEGKGKHASV